MDTQNGPSSGTTRHPGLTPTRSLEDQIMATPHGITVIPSQSATLTLTGLIDGLERNAFVPDQVTLTIRHGDSSAKTRLSVPLAQAHRYVIGACVTLTLEA